MKAVDYDYVLGNFEWTAMDFMGEVSLGWWSYKKSKSELYPWTSSYSGDIDLCGFKRPRSYFRDVLFNQGNKLSAFVFAPVHSFEGTGDSPWGWDDVKQSWTWPGYEGKELTVVAYSACDSVQLILNDKVIGTKTTSRKTEFKATWQVLYEQGTLKTIGYIKGIKTAESKLITAKKPAKIHLTVDRANIKADGQDLSYVTVEITDKNGLLNPQFNNIINFSIEGEGTIAAVGNSNPISVESFQQPYRKAYEGKCLVIIRSNKKAGQIILHTSGKGLTPDKIVINTKEY
jgi:beta-galactosidase